MKKLFNLLLILFIMIACVKDEDRESGICYCKFANGKKQQYDLTQFSRQEQIEKCNTHDNNAANFGGVCKLE